MSKHTPFFKFDSLSWLGGSIQFTDLASKGLFIDLCALYWESQKPVKIDTKFKVRVRCDEGTLTNLLGTLSDLDIIMQSEHGITIPFLDSLMSDRNKWLEKCSNAGKKSATNKGTSSNKKEESRKKKEECRKEKVDKNKDLEITFEIFWSDYPRKIGKGKARSSYETARKKASHDEIMRGVFTSPRLKGDDPQFLPHAATWLNQESWTDEGDKEIQTTIGKGSKWT